MGGPPLHRPVVTLAALYGAGGSVVGPQVAQRLGVPFLDRGISQAVAFRAGLPGHRECLRIQALIPLLTMPPRPTTTAPVTPLRARNSSICPRTVRS